MHICDHHSQYLIYNLRYTIYMESSPLAQEKKTGRKIAVKHKISVALLRANLSARFFFAIIFAVLAPLVLAVGIILFSYEAMFAQMFGNFGGMNPDAVSFAQAELARLRTQTVFIFIIFGGVAFLGLWFSNRMFVRPLQSFLAVMQKISEGNFSVSVPSIPGQEYEEVSQNFETMLANLQEVRRREKALLQTKNEFIRIAAHQLRTPLSALKWVFHMLLEQEAGTITDMQKNLLQKGYEANEGLLRIVNDLLSVADIEEGRFGYRFEAVNPVAIIEQVCGEFNPFALQKKVRLVFMPPRGNIPYLWADASRMNMVLGNLIANALSYTMSGGSVEVAIGSEKNAVVISVHDTGIGIPQSEQPFIFEKFFRGKSASETHPEGSGMGLFIAKNIVESHGGTIWFNSREGEGSVFSFRIPLHKAGGTTNEGATDITPQQP